jgi:ParB family chromosome partitioning protein
MSTRRSGLGRGLDALLESDRSSTPTSVPVDQLRPNRYQPRTSFDSPALAELAASIEAQGVVQPILVRRRNGGFTIIAGERRWRAAKRAGLKEVPVVVKDISNDLQMFEMALVENLQRADLNPIEEAEAYKRLLDDFGLTQEDVAARVGKGRSTITNALRLLVLPSEIQDLLRDGELTAGQVRPLLALDREDDQLRWARKAVKERLTARQMESAVGGAKGRRGGRKVQIDPDTAAAAEKLTKLFRTKVEIRRRGKGGTVSIAFHSEEELIGLFDLLASARRPS